MSPDFQHCPDCDEEYVAGIPSCAECGKPLVAGPLPHFERGGRASAAAPTVAGDAAGDEVFLVELPGLDAHEAVQALLLERIPCRATCQGLEKSYSPERPPQGPLATSLAVSLHVGSAHLEAAHEIIESLRGGDLIGELWSEAPHPDQAPDDADDRDTAVPSASRILAAPQGDAGPPADAPLQAQGTGGRTVLLLVAVAIIVALVLAFGRQ